MWPRVRYADADGVSIACDVRGDGPIDAVIVSGLIGGLIARCLDPGLTVVVDRWAAFSRVMFTLIGAVRGCQIRRGGLRSAQSAAV
jgi:hypothetical protein